MEHRYSEFKPSNSKYAQDLINNFQPSRYITPKQNTQKKFFDGFKAEIDKLDDDGYLLNPYLYQIQGANLNYVATQVFMLANKIKDSEYQFNLENIVYDLDTLFKEFSKDVERLYNSFQQNIQEPVTKYSQDIAYFYVNEILKPAIKKTITKQNIIEQ